MYNNASHVCFHAIVLYAICNGVLCDYHHKEGTYSRYISCIYDHNKVKFKFKCYSFAVLCGRLTERQQHKQEWPQTGCNTHFVPPSENSARCRQTSVLSVLDHRISFRVASPERKASRSRRRLLPSQYGSVAEKGSMQSIDSCRMLDNQTAKDHQYEEAFGDSKQECR